MYEEAKYMTALISHEGLYLYKRMPFGLQNAPSTFQKGL